MIKGWSPTMRHVSRTHRVALDWVFDRINLEPKIQIKYVDTKNQRADMLTKEGFTRDEWNHLLRLFNKVSFSTLSCSHFSNFLSDPIGKQSAMSKRGQETTSSKGSPTAKPKPMVPLGVTQSVEREGKSSAGFEISSRQGMQTKDRAVKLVQGNLYGPPKAQKSEVLREVLDSCKSKCLVLTKNCWESMENQLVSSEIFLQDFRPCRFF